MPMIQIFVWNNSQKYKYKTFVIRTLHSFCQSINQSISKFL